MINLKTLHTPYIMEETFMKLLKNIEEVEFTKAGGNSKCSIINGYIVLKTGNIPGHDDSFPKIIKVLKEIKDQGVNVVPILGYGVTKFGEKFKYSGKRYDKGYIVQEKAPGVELLDYNNLRNKTEEEQRKMVIEYIKMLSKIPQEHFDKWVLDYKNITDQKVMIDPSKNSNFFYDTEKGFSFIDLNFFNEDKLFDKMDNDGQQHHSHFILYTMIPFRYFLSENSYFYKYLKTSKDCAMAEKVAIDCFIKNLNALKKVGITEEDVNYAVETFKIELPKALQEKDNSVSC